jgi:hypothetical protein
VQLRKRDQDKKARGVEKGFVAKVINYFAQRGKYYFKLSILTSITNTSTPEICCIVSLSKVTKKVK